jgi:hypothetical protein
LIFTFNSSDIIKLHGHGVKLTRQDAIVLILGKTNDANGTQLEQIPQAMFSAKEFQNIELNSVGTGGAE